MKKFSYISLALAAMSLFSCQTDGPENEKLSVTTAEVTEITENSATSGGNVLSDGGKVITSRGVVWSTDPEPDYNDFRTEDGKGLGEFVSVLTDLEPGNVYPKFRRIFS